MNRAEIDDVMQRAAVAFADHGYSGVSVRDLADICNISAPSLYHYFGSKEQFFDAVCSERYRAAWDTVYRAVPADADLLTKMEVVAACIFDILVGDQVLFQLLRRDLIEGSVAGREPRSRRQHQALLDLTTEVLMERFSESDSRQLAFTTAALVFGYCEFVHVSINAQMDSPEITPERRRDELINALKRLIEGGPKTSIV